ncbi:Panacea domain-containing protein [Lacticaseibacillus baoqingensis]|nr:type II toxin-antitoxin system antitoxin SocA domain-containing protein [Lacticaseibacillus baoqingensis]
MTVANAVIEYLATQDKHIQNLLLQKTLYYLNADKMIATNGEEALIADNFEKWSYGPVDPEVYQTYRKYGSQAIPAPEPETIDDFLTSEAKLDSGHYYQDKITDSDTLKRIRKVSEAIFDHYQQKPFDLVQKTHDEPAWKEAENEIKSGHLHIKYQNNEIYQFLKQEGLKSWLNLDI